LFQGCSLGGQTAYGHASLLPLALKLGVQHFSSPDGTAIQVVFHHQQKKKNAC